LSCRATASGDLFFEEIGDVFGELVEVVREVA